MDATADIVGMGRTTVQVPEELADELHERKERGDSYADVIWRLIERADGESSTHEPHGAQAGNVLVEPESTAEPEQVEPERDERERARETLDDLDLQGSGKDYELRTEAVLTMYDELRSNPGVRRSKSDFADLLDGEDVGYSGGFPSLWSNWVKSNPAQGHDKNVLEQLPGVKMRANSYVYTRQEESSSGLCDPVEGSNNA